MKKAVDAGYVKVKPGKSNTKVELTCSVCKIFKCNMTAKGVEAKGHLGGKCKGKTILECFGKEAADFYGEGAVAAVIAKPAAGGKPVVKAAAPTSSCKHPKCAFLPSADLGMEGFCCGKCRTQRKALLGPDHGPACKKLPEE